MKSRSVILLDLLSDGEMHSNAELNSVVGWSFGSYIHYLKKNGCVFEKESRRGGDREYIEYFRLVSKPETMTLCKDGNSLRIKNKTVKQKSFWDWFSIF